MKYSSDRPFNDPEAVARTLLDLVRNSIATSGLPYTGAVNLAFMRAGGKPNLNVAVQALRLCCDLTGMLVHRHEMGAPNDFARMSDAELV